MDADLLRRRFALVSRIPLVAHLGVEALDPEDPATGVRLTVTGDLDNGAGGLHGSATNALVETAAYLALARELEPDEHAVTHAISTSILDRTQLGDVVEARGVLDRRSRRLGFLSVLAVVGERPVARATLVKSIVPWPDEQPGEGGHGSG